MTVFWLAVVIVSVLSVAALLWPLWRGRPGPLADEDPRAHDLAVYRDQLTEITREVESGVLAPSEAEAASLEIKRRLLRAADGPEKSERSPPGRGSARLLAVLLVLVIPATAMTIYAIRGRPDLSDQPFAGRTAPTSPDERTVAKNGQEDASRNEEARKTLDDAVAALVKHLAASPNDARGWFLLGRAYLTSERYDDAVEALRRANDLVESQPEVAAAYGEALVMAADGRVTDQAQQVFEGAFARDPRNPQARYFLGLRKAQTGDLPGALQDWVDLVALSSSEAPWLPAVTRQIIAVASTIGVDPATLKPRPDARALAAAPPEGAANETASVEQREAMIRAMVERLANRLQQNPNDAEGWLRLAHAYDVLGEKAKADQARARAYTLAPPSIR